MTSCADEGTRRADMVIVGVGPCGLFQAFERGLLGIGAHADDARAPTHQARVARHREPFRRSANRVLQHCRMLSTPSALATGAKAKQMASCREMPARLSMKPPWTG